MANWQADTPKISSIVLKRPMQIKVISQAMGHHSTVGFNDGVIHYDPQLLYYTYYPTGQCRIVYSSYPQKENQVPDD